MTTDSPTATDPRTYTCPMHPDVRKVGPGNCPKCGMALEPMEAEQPKEKMEYVCPMHPQIVRAWVSVVRRQLNMFTLIALGVGVSYVFSLFATFAPGLFPPSFRNKHGMVEVYFEVAAVITTLVLLGQVLELRARSRTSSAI